MTEALVSAVLEQLISVVAEGIRQEVRLVVGVDREVEKLRNNFEAVQAVLVDAEARQVKETTVRLWLDRLKQASYDVEDVLDEWNYALLEQRVEGVENDLIPGKKKGWEEWEYEIARIGEEEEDITIMPSLVSLSIHDCPKLKALPKHLVQNTRLEKLISDCPLLDDRKRR